MAITPLEDKMSIKAIIDTDTYLTETQKIKPENVKTTGATSDVLNGTTTDNETKVYISNGTPENLGSDIAKGLVYNIKVVSKRTRAIAVTNTMRQIIALLNFKDIGRGHILYLLDPQIELVTDPAIYAEEVTFLCQSTVFDTVKK